MRQLYFDVKSIGHNDSFVELSAGNCFSNDDYKKGFVKIDIWHVRAALPKTAEGQHVYMAGIPGYVQVTEGRQAALDHSETMPSNVAKRGRAVFPTTAGLLRHGRHHGLTSANSLLYITHKCVSGRAAQAIGATPHKEGMRNTSVLGGPIWA